MEPTLTENADGTATLHVLPNFQGGVTLGIFAIAKAINAAKDEGTLSAEEGERVMSLAQQFAEEILDDL